jgi:hypothetical protein
MLRPLVTAIALGLAAGVSNFAAAGEGEPAPLQQESMVIAPTYEGYTARAVSDSQVVTTRADQNIYQQYGRDSVYGFSPDRKPLKPEQTAARNAEGTSSVD